MTLGDGEPYSLGGAQSAAPHISKSPILLRHLFFDLYRIFLRTSALVIILSGQLSLFALKPSCKPMVVFIFCSQQDLCPIINRLNFVSQGSRIPLNQLFHKNMSRPRSRLNSAPRQGQMAKQDGTKVLGRTTSQSDTSSLTFVCDCTKLRMLLKSRLHQLLRWSNFTHSATVRDIVVGSVLTFNRCLNGGTSVTKWVLCVIDYKQTPLQPASKKQGAKTAHIRTLPP